MKNKSLLTRTAKLYCKDPIEMIPGYKDALESDEFCVIHHVLELTLDGERAHTVEELKRMGMYYNRPYFELIVLTTSEHSRIHNQGKNNFAFRIRDKETARRNLSLSLKGHYGWNKGKTWSSETRAKMRKSHLGKQISPEGLAKLRKINDERVSKFRKYKADGGELKYNDWVASIWPSVKGGSYV